MDPVGDRSPEHAERTGEPADSTDLSGRKRGQNRRSLSCDLTSGIPVLPFHEESILFRSVDANCSVLDDSHLNGGPVFECPELFELFEPFKR